MSVGGDQVDRSPQLVDKPLSSLPAPPPPPRTAPPVPDPSLDRASALHRAAITALALTIPGWLLWVYAAGAELDTGHPGGSACTGDPEGSQAYADCMLNSERGGSIAWSLTLAAAVAAAVVMMRSRRRTASTAGTRLGSAAWLLTALLASAAVAACAGGILGAFYDDRLGTRTWSVTVILGAAVGSVLGWALAPRSDTSVPDPVSRSGVGSIDAARGRGAIAAGFLGGALAVGGALLLFMAGDHLFGSDSGAIDSYHHEVLRSCETPEDATLIAAFVFRTVEAGSSIRTMTYVWASPRPPDELADLFGLGAPGEWSRVPEVRACRFDQRPAAVVYPEWLPEELPEGTEMAYEAAVPANSRAFVMLQLGQRERDGIFGSAVIPR